MTTKTAPVPADNTFGYGVVIPVWQTIVIAVIGLGTWFICHTTQNANSVTESGVNMDLPIFVEQYMGTEQEASLSEKTMLPADTQILKKEYSALNGEKIMAQIVLSGGEKRSIHRPEVCLPGQGWTIKDGREIPVKLDNGATQHVMKLTLSRTIEVAEGDRRELTNEFFYWFVGKDKTTAQHKQRIWLTSWDRVFHNVNHRWAYVVVSSLVYNKLNDKAPNEQQTVESVKKFIGKIAPEIQKSTVISG